jgi:uncharacterized protein (TIGR02058 family)
MWPKSALSRLNQRSDAVAGNRFIVEIGTGIDLHGEDVTKAACRAVKDAVSSSCLCGLVEILGIQNLQSNELEVEILVAVPRPQEVDLNRVMAEVPTGRKTAHAIEGGMMTKGICVAQFVPDSSQIVVAIAAVTVSINK